MRVSEGLTVITGLDEMIMMD